MNLREQLFQYVKNKYKAVPEYLWMRFPDYAVFRHSDNGKWFGIVMNVSGEKLGLQGDDKVDILNVKLPDKRRRKSAFSSSFFPWVSYQPGKLGIHSA